MAKAKGFNADFTAGPDPNGVHDLVLSLKGDWRIQNLAGLRDRLNAATRSKSHIEINTQDVEYLDTAGAYLIGLVLKARLSNTPFAGQPEFEHLYVLVAATVEKVSSQAAYIERPHLILLRPLWNLMDKLGHGVIAVIRDLMAKVDFIGHVVSALILSLTNPHRVRLTPLFSLMQRAGFEALPIIGITNFFVGAVIAFLGVLQLQQFGASIYAVDMIGMAVLREFGPVIAAVLLAGRSASSFAAEIGAMKMNQEIDAMRVLGIDPFDALVVPRLVAMIITAPLVSFFGAMCGLTGGAVIIWSVLGYEPSFFVQRLLDNVPFVHFYVGLFKTPFFAGVIALIGCHAGMTVESDVISLGRQVTRAVVQAIFAIFLLNAAFALLFNGFELK